MGSTNEDNSEINTILEQIPETSETLLSNPLVILGEENQEELKALLAETDIHVLLRQEDAEGGVGIYHKGLELKYTILEMLNKFPQRASEDPRTRAERYISIPNDEFVAVHGCVILFDHILAQLNQFQEQSSAEEYMIDSFELGDFVWFAIFRK